MYRVKLCNHADLKNYLYYFVLQSLCFCRKWIVNGRIIKCMEFDDVFYVYLRPRTLCMYQP